jgi:hypothetical protein
MFSLIIKYSLNNIFLTALLYEKKIYSKSTGQFLEYSKGKRKVSNLALLQLLNNFLNFYSTNFKNFVIFALTIELYGCTLKRYFFLKKNLSIVFSKIEFKYLFFLDKHFFSFNGCRLKKKRRKKKRKKRVRIN